MKTKTLLIAAAALAVGVISSEAQVYSQNVVGYVNVAAPSGQFVMLANPLDTGNNVLSNVVKGASGGSTVQIWNSGTGGFDLYTYSALTHAWKQGTSNADNTPLPPGVGFFLSASTAFTNTFVGTVVTPINGSSTNTVATGFQAVGSLTPYGDVVTNGATVNLVVGGGTTLQQWDIASQAFNLYTYSGLSHAWKQGTTVTNPVVSVGEGFFINSGTPVIWTQTLTNN